MIIVFTILGIVCVHYLTSLCSGFIDFDAQPQLIFEIVLFLVLIAPWYIVMSLCKKRADKASSKSA
jgi:hypothetical protein